MADVRYDPVSLDLARDLAAAMERPDFKRAHDALEEEFAALDVLLEARRRAGLTQEQVAERMGMKQSSLARVESSLASKKHAPSLSTLRRYAEAVGCKLEIHLVSKSRGERMG